MPDYQEMYLHLMRETEKAIRILVKAQQDCEELYLREAGPALRILPSASRQAEPRKNPRPRNNAARMILPTFGHAMDNPQK